MQTNGFADDKDSIWNGRQYEIDILKTRIRTNHSEWFRYFQSLFQEKYPEMDVQAWHAQLGRFGLSGSHQMSPIKQLSDGLRNRCVFCLF